MPKNLVVLCNNCEGEYLSNGYGECPLCPSAVTLRELTFELSKVDRFRTIQASSIARLGKDMNDLAAQGWELINTLGSFDQGVGDENIVLGGPVFGAVFQRPASAYDPDAHTAAWTAMKSQESLHQQAIFRARQQVASHREQERWESLGGDMVDGFMVENQNTECWLLRCETCPVESHEKRMDEVHPFGQCSVCGAVVRGSAVVDGVA